MKKLAVFMLLVVMATIFAGLYGMIHNQISYSVSPEYFTKFKFIQFGLDGLPLSDRLRASVVGLMASWWMGIPIGCLVGVMGFIHSGPRRMFVVSTWSFLIVVGFTLLFGLGGLAYGWLETRTIQIGQYRQWFIPDNVVDLRRFLCAGYMHNASYLGGMLAILAAWAFHILIKFKAKNG